MSWRTETVKSSFDASDFITDASRTIGDFFSSIVEGIGNVIGDLFQDYDVIGINVSEVDNMRQAIRDYEALIEKHLEEVNTYADTNQAFKGEYATAIKDYVYAVTLACRYVVSYLNAFSDQLKEIKDAYEAQDVEQASKIRQTSSATESQFSRYQEKY